MRTLAIGIIRVYRYIISPLLGPCCRYYPSCSEYAETAFRKHGAIKGAALTGWRLLRCNPWSAGGVDYVPGCDPNCCDHEHTLPESNPDSPNNLNVTAVSK